MTHIAAIILGFVEGATEFIPVSSSGHLIIARQILGAGVEGGLAFDAVLQLATSLALVIYFWKDMLALVLTAFRFVTRKTLEVKEKTLLYAVVLGTIPAVVLGLLLEKDMDTLFRNIHLVALTLVLGSLLMWYAQKKSTGNKELSVWGGVRIGFYQCLALLPGVSRSGATISGGLLSGLSKEEAVRFSFVLSIPVLIGAGLKKLFEVRHELFTSAYGSSLFVGSIVAFVIGYLSIYVLIKYLKNHSLDMFIWYRVALAIVLLFMF